MSNATLSMSNMPGPKVGWRYGKAHLTSVGFHLPCIGELALGVGVMSVGSTITYTISGDKSQLKNPKRFRELFEGLFDELCLKIE